MSRLLLFIIIGISFLAGAFGEFFIDSLLPVPLSNSKKSYQAGFTTAKSLVENSSFGSAFKTLNDIRTLSGTVVAVNDTSITLHTPPSVNPFDDPSLQDRIIIIDSSTKIVELRMKDPSVFQSEADAFMKPRTSSSTNALPAIPPLPFIQIDTDLAHIRAGSTIIVNALENIKTAKQFTASEIQIQPSTQLK